MTDRQVERFKKSVTHIFKDATALLELLERREREIDLLKRNMQTLYFERRLYDKACHDAREWEKVARKYKALNNELRKAEK